MERIINLPNAEAIREFVDVAGKNEDAVLVAKEGYKFQIDGASILGMMAVIGQNIKVSFLGSNDRFNGILERYSVAH